MGSIEYAIDKLPELPLEALSLTGDLGHAGTAPVLTIRQKETKPPDRPVTPAPHVEVPESTTTRYGSQCTYPRLTCYPYSELIAETLDEIGKVVASEKRESNPSAIDTPAQFFKLSTHKGIKLERPYYCTVHYGPWAATVIRQSSCILGEPRFWRFYIVEMPDVNLSWYGVWEDIPSYPSLHVIMGELHQIGDVVRSCCLGHKWCSTTNSCIPNGVPCEGSPFPV